MQHERHRHHHHHHHHDQQQNKGYTHTVRVSFVLHRQDGAITQMPHNSIMIRGLNETQEKSILWITLFHWDVFFSHFEFCSRCEKEFIFLIAATQLFHQMLMPRPIQPRTQIKFKFYYRIRANTGCVANMGQKICSAAIYGNISSEF